MSLVKRRAAIVAAALVALLSLAAAVGAQEGTTAVRVAGSAIAAGMVDSAAFSAGVPVAIEANGTAAGLAALCASESDVALANRPITAQEEAACLASGVEFYELLLGHTAAAVITHSASPAPECLGAGQLSSIFAPSSAGQVTTWEAIASGSTDPLTIFLPGADSLPVALLDQVVSGVGIRTDATVLASDSDVIESVASTPGSVGVVTFAALADLPESVRSLELNTTAAGCTAATVAGFESRAYAMAAPLLAYVNSASETAAPLLPVLADMTEVAQVLQRVGPSATAVARNAAIVADSNTGREFTRYVVAFTIPSGVTGAVLVGGSSAALDLMTTLGTMIATEYQGLVITSTLLGQQAGLDSMCTGANDLAVAVGTATPEQLALCADNSVEPMAIPLGGRPVVVVANAADPALTCLTSDQLTAVFTTDAASWDVVDATLSATPITVLAPTNATGLGDLLVRLTAGPNALMRLDVIADNDPLYRAAAVANVAGAVTFMDWNDYKQVTANGQTGIQLVGIGADCVEPGEDAFIAGNYPLWEPLTLYANPARLAKPAVQSALWYLLSEENFALLGSANVYGLAFDSLNSLHDDLQDAFTAAQVAAEEAAAAQATAEATPEATQEG